MREHKKKKKHAEQNAQRLTLCEQYSKNQNIEIKNVPEVRGENLAAVLQKIGELIEEPIAEGDVDICHRLPAGKQSACPNAVAQFILRSKRDAVIEKARKKRMTTADLGHASRTTIYVNEHLCPELKKLLGMTVAKKTRAEMEMRLGEAKQNIYAQNGKLQDCFCH